MITYDALKNLLIINIFIENNNKNWFTHLMTVWMSLSSAFFFFWNRPWNDFLMWQCHCFWTKTNMDELKTTDNEHTEFLMNQWCSSSIVDNFAIYFFFSMRNFEFHLWISFFTNAERSASVCVHQFQNISKSALFERISSQFSNESIFNSIEEEIFDSCWNICEFWKAKKKRWNII